MSLDDPKTPCCVKMDDDAPPTDIEGTGSIEPGDYILLPSDVCEFVIRQFWFSPHTSTGR